MRVVKRGLLLAVLAAALFAIPTAAASQPPTLVSVAQESRHASAHFSMPGADYASIYFASKPDRATDGSFLQENVKDSDSLTSDEIQNGAWLDESQLDPGTYYAMVQATDIDCIGEPTCLGGYSNVLTLSVPKPAQRYRASVNVLHYVHVAYLTLRVAPLGEALPYKVCWRLKNKARRCLARSVKGYSWNSAADDQASVQLRGLARRTTFTWYVRGSRVAVKSANTRAY
jgi:hypothetical protein